MTADQNGGALARGPENAQTPAPPAAFSSEAARELDEIVAHYPERKAACLPALWMAQREHGGCLTQEALREVAGYTGLPITEVEAVASYYTMFSTLPRGRHHLEVCTCLTCAVMGAYDVLHKLEHDLGIEAGETTADGEFTLSEVECLDYCGAATVMQVGDKYFTDLTADNVGGVIEELRSSPDHTPEKLAEAVVDLHRSDNESLRAFNR